MINIFQPDLGLNELLAVADTFKSNWIGKGKKVDQFEADFARHLGLDPRNFISTTSATEALFQICELIDVRDQEVILPSIHHISAANAIITNGGRPVFCDVDRHTLNTNNEYFEPLVTDKTKAIILLHYGNECEVKGAKIPYFIHDLACNPSIAPRSGFAVWSFDAMKILSTGDGGMIYTFNDSNYRALRNRMYLGLMSESGLGSINSCWWQYRSVHPGRRATMNDITAAIGIEQLKRLPELLKKRRTLAAMYRTKLDERKLHHIGISDYFIWIQLDRRDELARHLREKGIYTTFKYWPLHKALGVEADLPNTEWAAAHTLNLPLHTGLDYYDVDYVCELVNGF